MRSHSSYLTISKNWSHEYNKFLSRYKFMVPGMHYLRVSLGPTSDILIPCKVMSLLWRTSARHK